MILPIGYWVAQLIGWKVNEKAENISTEKALVSDSMHPARKAPLNTRN